MCDEHLDEEEVQYNPETAWFLLRSRGNIDVCDFIADGVDPSKYGELGWGVRIKHHSITLQKAVDRIYDVDDNGFFHVTAGSGSQLVEEDEDFLSLVNLRHYAFILLRKADVASIVFSRLETEQRNTVYASTYDSWTVMFLLPGNKEFEFRYSYDGT